MIKNIIENLTNDHKKLLYLIQKYSKVAENRFEKEKWIKEIPLRTLVYEGILMGVFEDYDYSPLSVEMLGGRRLVNISQEAEDDFADLREMNLIECLKLSGGSSKLTVAYRITPLAKQVNIPLDFKEAVNKLVSCPVCGSLKTIEYNFAEDELVYIRCSSPICNDYQAVSTITEYKDINYSTRPYFPIIPRNMQYEIQRTKMGFVRIDYEEILKARENDFKCLYQSKYHLEDKEE